MGAALDELEEKLVAARAGQTEGIVGTIMEKLRAEGEAKGEAKSLTRLLERRFGPLPAGCQGTDQRGRPRPA